jgi:alkaline phosphatase D
MKRSIALLGFVLCAATRAQGQMDAAPLPTGEVTRIAFGSCAKQWQTQPIWEAVMAQKPDLWLFLGDAVYADTDGKTAWLVSKEQLAGEWNRLADKPEFQKARAALPMMATWDNHDYGSHAGGAEFPVKQESKDTFLTFFEEPKDSPRWKRSGVYDAKILGPEGKRVQIILLDTKYNRSAFKKDPTPKEEQLKAGKVGAYIPDPNPAKTHLGEQQWRWLAQALQKPAELRLICSSTQVIPNQKGMDEWGNFPHERKRLLAVAQTAGNVVLLSGNVHFAEISQLQSLVEFSSSGMTHINETYAAARNRFRIQGPCIDHHFGLVEINWQHRPGPQINMKAITVSGTIAFNHQFTLQEH